MKHVKVAMLFAQIVCPAFAFGQSYPIQEIADHLSRGAAANVGAAITDPEIQTLLDQGNSNFSVDCRGQSLESCSTAVRKGVPIIMNGDQRAAFLDAQWPKPNLDMIRTMCHLGDFFECCKLAAIV